MSFDDIPRAIIEGYYTPRPRVTADGQWTEQELCDNIRYECLKHKSLMDKENGKALYQPLMLLPDYMADVIIDGHDVVDMYNVEAAKDTKKYGIAMFDQWILTEIKRLLEENRVVK